MAIESVWRDIRFAVRLLLSRPGWSVAAILCLAIATGANTAAFSVVNALILRPLPFADAHQLVMVALQERTRADTRPFSLDEYRDLAGRGNHTVQLIARTFLPLSLTTADGARMVEAEFVSANYFEVLRVAPAAGSFFRADNDRAGAEATAVISHQLWQRRFNGDPAIVGRTVRMNGRPFTVRAIAPAGFVGATRLIAADVWIPAAFFAELARTTDANRTPMFGVMGRMAPDGAPERVRAALDTAVAAMWSDQAAERPAVIVHGASGFGVPPIARALVFQGSALIFGLMGLLMAVAAANVAALVLARAAGRGREIGVRLAMGASRSRVARQLATESLVLAIAGGLTGGLLALWVTRILAARISTPFDYVSYAVDIQPDLRVLVYSTIVVAATAVLSGLAPVWQSARVDLVEVLKRSAAGGRRRSTSRALRGLVVAQFAVSAALLVSCGLLVRTYLNTQRSDPGIATRNLIAVSLDVTQLGAGADEGRRVFAAARSRIAAEPDVVATSLTRRNPLGPPTTDVRVAADDGRDAVEVKAGGEIVTAEHFRLIGIPIVLGRGFAEEEPELPLVALINETLARKLWTSSPLGRRFRIDGRADRVLTVVGVVKDVPARPGADAPQPVFYRPFSQAYAPDMKILVQVQDRPAAAMDAIRRDIQHTNADLAILDLRTLDDYRAANGAFRRQVATGLSVVAAVGLLLSSLGLLGVVSYGVRERAREFGIRLALGARAADVRWMVIRQGLSLTLAGLVAGVALSLAVADVLRSLVVGVSVRDPITISVVSAVLSVVSLVALAVPARYATAVEPADVLRAE